MQGTVQYLKVYETTKPKMRLGSPHDGGYVCIDDIGNYDAYFGIGVSDNTDFDNDFVRRYNVRGYCYDGTIDRAPYNLDKRCTFIKQNISGVKSSFAFTNLEEETSSFSNIFLKIDIEGYEWQWFKHMTDKHLLRYKQIVVEIHDFEEEGTTNSDKIFVLHRLSKHFHLLHAHGNNNGHMISVDGCMIPWVMELTYVRKDVIPYVSLNTHSLPSLLDSPNNTSRFDHDLNHYPFVHKSI